MSRFFAGVVLLTVAFVALVLVVRAVGGTAKNSLATMFTVVDLPNGKTQACWHDICPGQTTLDDAKRILAADKSLTMPDSERFPFCWESHVPYYVVCLGNRDNRLINVQVDINFQLNPIEI